MTNPTTPYGFRGIGLIDGTDPNFGVVTRPVSNTNTASMYAGDPAIMSLGYATVATTTGSSGAAVAGVFEGFEWESVAAKRKVFSQAWLGNTADIVSGSQLYAKINVSPQSVFQARSTGAAAIAQQAVGGAVNFTQQTVPGSNNLSTFMIDGSTIVTGANSGTLPFKIHAIVQSPASDPTTVNNDIQVIFNPSSFLAT